MKILIEDRVSKWQSTLSLQQQFDFLLMWTGIMCGLAGVMIGYWLGAQ